MTETLSPEQERIIDAVHGDAVEQVRVWFLDYNGIARARSVMPQRLAAAFRQGVNVSSPTLDFNSRDLFPPGAAFDLATPDVWAVPDPATYRPGPVAGNVAEMLADLTTLSGNPWPGCPRQALRRQEHRAAERSLLVLAGFEPEGYLFRRLEGVVGFAGAPQFATLDGLDIQPDFMLDLLDYLREAGIEVTQWSEEYGPGQVEINLTHGTPLESADRIAVYRHAFRAIARHHGLVGTFMPKPFGNQAGSGLHVHLSLADPRDPSHNLLDDPSDTGMGLSERGRFALGGLLAHGPALVALGATTVNSYKRFLPGSWAPTHVGYAYASRAAFVRVPERETARRLELRAGDPACNPYMYLAGIVAAMLDGIDRRLEPGNPAPGDVGVTGDASGLARLPRTLEHALDALETDEVICEALGPIIAAEFIKVKRSEWEAFVGHVGAWDRDWYLDRY